MGVCIPRKSLDAGQYDSIPPERAPCRKYSLQAHLPELQSRGINPKSDWTRREGLIERTYSARAESGLNGNWGIATPSSSNLLTAGWCITEDLSPNNEFLRTHLPRHKKFLCRIT